MVNNIYNDLLSYDYFNLDNSKKKQIIDYIIKYYLISVIDEYNKCGYLCYDFSTEDIVDYFENHYSLVPLILFIINLINQSQYNKISWIVNPSKNNIDIVYNINEIDRIISNEKYGEVFKLLYKHYLNSLDNNKTLKK